MSVCAHDNLAQLLIIVQMRKTKPVVYSIEKPQTLWDGGDRVEERTRRFYVTLRHFSGEIIGQHVGLVGPVEKLKDNFGERRTYRLPVGTIPNEHLCVYVYNPAVCENGTLPIEINTVDMNAPKTTRHQHAHHSAKPTSDAPTTDFCVSVEPDQCQAVLTFHHQSIHNSHVTRLFNTDDNYLVELRIFLENSM
jgi:hypothetical protein